MAVISFVIPVYNGERTLKACLESILLQDHSDFAIEIIVVNNNSTDRSQEIAEQFSENVQVLFLKELSRARARQTGIEKSKGNFIAFIDSDVILERNWASTLFDYLKTSPQTGGVQAPIIPKIEKRWHWLRFKRTKIKTLGTFVHLSAVTSGIIPVINTAASLWRRSALGTGFDPTLGRAEDIDLTMNVLRSGYSLGALMSTRAYVRYSGNIFSWFKRFYEQGLFEKDVYKKYAYPYPQIEIKNVFRHPLFAGTSSLLLLSEMLILSLFKWGLKNSRHVSHPAIKPLKNLPSFMYQSFKNDRYFVCPECRTLTVADRVGIFNLITKKCFWVAWDESRWSDELTTSLVNHQFVYPRD